MEAMEPRIKPIALYFMDSWLHGFAASALAILIDGSEAGNRPVSKDRLAVNIIPWDEPPVTTVVARIAVVT